jgi:hypothetical protein
MQNETLISTFSVLIAATGISLVFKDYLASLLGGFILRNIRQVKAGVRVKVLVGPAVTIKGDVISVGAIRTTETRPFTHLETVDEDMRAAIAKDGQEVVDVGLYQREERLIIHGIFKVQTHEAGDVRGRILVSFLERRQARAAVAEPASPVRTA